DRGAAIINMSLGLYADADVVREAVHYAHDKGVVMVAAAGNDAFTQLAYPAAYPEVLAVTAVDAAGRQALFPNQSTTIDFAAPGVGLLAAAVDDRVESFSGTSAAAPVVTGTLAALISEDPSWTPIQAVAVLQRYLNDAGAAGIDPVYGAGVLDWDRLRE